MDRAARLAASPLYLFRSENVRPRCFPARWSISHRSVARRSGASGRASPHPPALRSAPAAMRAPIFSFSLLSSACGPEGRAREQEAGRCPSGASLPWALGPSPAIRSRLRIESMTAPPPRFRAGCAPSGPIDGPAHEMGAVGRPQTAVGRSDEARSSTAVLRAPSSGENAGLFLAVRCRGSPRPNRTSRRRRSLENRQKKKEKGPTIGGGPMDGQPET